MENKAHAMAAGLFVVAVVVIVLVLAGWLTRDTGVRDAYEISTRESISGLQPQAAVRYRGVDVGKVDNIGFDPKAQGNVLIKLEVDRDAPVTKNTFATLGYQGVTGLAFVQLDDEGQPAPKLKAEGGNAPRIPLRPGLLQKLTEKGEALLDQADKALAKVNQLLADPNQKRVASALDNIGTAAANLSQLSTRLDSTVQTKLDPALAEAKTTLQSVRTSSDEFGRTAKRINAPDGPIDRLAEGTQALSHAADSFNSATLPRINRVTEETGRAVRLLGRTAGNIGDNPQSLIYGNGPTPPGPGEPGFTPPGGAK
ncbi:MlaD family protein [Ramlibacter sp. PS4R-6]|uniref:MlaD family protein n=1 Tax=Ramlibacter sp. PS4R-6 TaxID=3133438 RepID=UPI0030972C33